VRAETVASVSPRESFWIKPEFTRNSVIETLSGRLCLTALTHSVSFCPSTPSHPLCMKTGCCCLVTEYTQSVSSSDQIEFSSWTISTFQPVLGYPRNNSDWLQPPESEEQTLWASPASEALAVTELETPTNPRESTAQSERRGKTVLEAVNLRHSLTWQCADVNLFLPFPIRFSQENLTPSNDELVAMCLKEHDDISSEQHFDILIHSMHSD